MSNNNKMLIDATHPEETRVVVLRNGRVEEFDFESAARKLLRGNIYLAKVTRVEPSLQAAFVDYGGNRHGFLAFSEIHPDYYQIPLADRQALLEEEAAAEAAEEAEVDAHAERLARRRASRQPRDAQRGDVDGAGDDAGQVSAGGEFAGHSGDQGSDDDHAHRTIAEDTAPVEEIISEAMPPETVGGFDPVHPQDSAPRAVADGPAARRAATDAAHGDHGAHAQPDHEHHDHGGHDGHGGADHEHTHDTHDHDHGSGHIAEPANQLEGAGGEAEDTVEEMPQRPRRRPRSYKIQEVIKRRQVILVQVVKEERGNKGAALTTYLSLAGRYTVLMPNTARGGGISRKITQPQDRKRLKAIANELEVPEGMGLIIRTAGAARTSQEIKRDFEYLLRLWESVRELTLQSTAPSLVYEEGNLIKRSIRDLYNKDVEEIVVAGAQAQREAHDFMRMLMPSHAKNVIEYKGAEPLFTRYRMEQQLAAMFLPQVTLKSGGYLVINQTEALVAIDVNSGKSTREYSIEETALNTNLEASDEIARQLKLRDLAGLIVIDFIDMEEKRNNRAVERRLKDALRFDRARIQLGRISHFGLMEMSRQRLRTGVLEGSTSQCPHCQGTGIIRSVESIALAVIRGLEDALLGGTRMALLATTTPQVALYILNAKRGYITDMEARHGLSITIQGSDKLQGANFTIDKVAPVGDVAARRRPSTAVNMDWGFDGETTDEPLPDDTLTEIDPSAIDEGDDDATGDGREPRAGDSDGGEDGRRKRRRRGRRGRRDERPADEPRFGRDDPQPSARFAGDEPTGDIVDVGSDDDAPEFVGGTGEGDDDAASAEGGARAQPRGPRAGGGELDSDGRSRRGRRRGRRGGRRGGQGRDRQPLGVGETAEFDVQGGGDQPYAEDHDGALIGHRDGQGAGSNPAIPEFDAPRHDGGDDLAAVQPSRERSREPRAPRDRGRRNEPRHRDGPRAAEPMDAGPAPAFDATPAAAPVTVAAPKPAAVPAPAAAVEAAPEPRVRRVSSGSSEPVLERVVVSPQAGSETQVAESSTADAKPSRRGWWQRKLGLE
jgi:ribonuclease E